MSEIAEIPFNPEDFVEFSKIKDENIVLGINIGMEIEAISRNFYQNIAIKLSPDKRFILKFLANEKLDHIRTLMAFQIALQKSGNWISLSEKQLKRVRLPRLYDGKGSIPDIKEDASNVDIILAAMRSEKRTEQFYKRIEKKVKDSKAKFFFSFLARFERAHYSLLKGLLEAAST